jgi:hypothetical protein
MKAKIGGLILFWIGSAIMIIVGWAYSWWMVPNIAEIGKSAMSGFIGYLWMFSVTLGGLIAALGAAVYTKENRARVLLILIVPFVVLVGLSFLISFKTVPSPLFGIGGGLIVLAYMGIVWNWIKTRSKLSKGERLGADIKIVGYFFFLSTAWYLCGLFGSPNFLLRPELIGQYTTTESVIKWASYQVFVSFVLGWILLSVGHLIAGKANRAK